MDLKLDLDNQTFERQCFSKKKLLVEEGRLLRIYKSRKNFFTKIPR